MRTVSKSGDPYQSRFVLFIALHEAASPSEREAARFVLAALEDLVEAGLANWHERRANSVELRGVRGEAWLLDHSGVTRLR